MVQEVLKVSQDGLDHKVKLDRLVDKDPRVSLDSQDPLDLLVHEVRKDPRASLAPKVAMGLLVQLVHKVRLDGLDLRVKLDQLDQVVFQVDQVLLVHEVLRVSQVCILPVFSIFTPHVSDGCNSFDNVCECLCLSVSLTLLTKQTDIQT